MENKKYSILFVALYCYTGHIKAVIEHLRKKNPLVEITLLTNLEPNEAKIQFGDYVNHIFWYDVKSVSHIKNEWLKSLVIRYKQNRYFSKLAKENKGKFDIVNVHFPKWYLSYAYKYLRSMGSHLIITPWGSDVLRIKDPKALKRLGTLYTRADYIATSPTTPLGLKIIKEFKVDEKRIKGNFFGSDIIDYSINHGNSISQEEAQRHYGLTGRYVITCGYNRKPAQRHKEIIAAINSVRDKLPSNLTLLFPMTYGNPRTETDYVEDCRKECEKYGIPAVFVTDFLSVEDMYKLRKATDMFVHVQPTDASSGSLKEYILCDKKIVHGSWIKYEDMEAFKPLFYFPVNRLEELGEVIVNAYNSDKIKIPQGVIDYIIRSGTEYRTTQMNDFFMSIVE